MYFWNTKKLSEKIKHNELTEKNKKNYYLGATIYMYLSMYLAYIQPRSNMKLLAIEAVLLLIITLIGFNVTFNSNGGDSGKDYISRMAIVAFPISIKLFLLSYLVLSLMGIVGAALSLEELTAESSLSTVGLSMQVLFFWRLNSAIKFINE